MISPNDSSALRERSDLYPARYGGRVPSAIRMLRTVRGDVPRRNPLTAVRGTVYPCLVNRHGAVAALVLTGPNHRPQALGVKGDEFEVVAWHDPVAEQERVAHPCPNRA